MSPDGLFPAEQAAAGDPGQPTLRADGPSLHPTAEVRASRFGPWTAVGARSRVIDCTIGAYSYVVEDASLIHCEVGRFCSLAAAVRLNPGNHPTWRACQHHVQYRAAAYGMGEDEFEFFAWRRGHPVRLGHDVWIGHGAIVLPGRTVGNGAVVGAGAVVTRDVAPYAIVAGNPAEPIRPRFGPAIAERLQALAWWDWPHVRIAAALADIRALTPEAFLERHEAAAPLETGRSGRSW